jgi:hypothetical protein
LHFQWLRQNVFVPLGNPRLPGISLNGREDPGRLPLQSANSQGDPVKFILQRAADNQEDPNRLTLQQAKGQDDQGSLTLQQAAQSLEEPGSLSLQRVALSQEDPNRLTLKLANSQEDLYGSLALPIVYSQENDNQEKIELTLPSTALETRGQHAQSGLILPALRTFLSTNTPSSAGKFIIIKTKGFCERRENLIQ